MIEPNIQTQFPHNGHEYEITIGLATILKAIRHFGKIDIAGFTFYCENNSADELLGYYGPMKIGNQVKYSLYNYIIINHLVETEKLMYVSFKEKQILDNFLEKNRV